MKLRHKNSITRLLTSQSLFRSGRHLAQWILVSHMVTCEEGFLEFAFSSRYLSGFWKFWNILFYFSQLIASVSLHSRKKQEYYKSSNFCFLAMLKLQPTALHSSTQMNVHFCQGYLKFRRTSRLKCKTNFSFFHDAHWKKFELLPKKIMI